MASNYIYDNVDPNANIIFGALVDEKLGDKVRITVLATGFDTTPGKASNALPIGLKKDAGKSPSFPGSTAPSPAPAAPASAQRMAASAAAAAAALSGSADYDDEALPAATPAAPRQPAYQQPPPPPPQAAPDQSFLQSFRRM